MHKFCVLPTDICSNGKCDRTFRIFPIVINLRMFNQRLKQNEIVINVNWVHILFFSFLFSFSYLFSSCLSYFLAAPVWNPCIKYYAIPKYTICFQMSHLSASPISPSSTSTVIIHKSTTECPSCCHHWCWGTDECVWESHTQRSHQRERYWFFITMTSQSQLHSVSHIRDLKTETETESEW